MQQCIPQGNFLLTLHSTLNVLELVERPGYQQITGFLGAIGASFSKDDRVFTANNKMMVSLEQLHHLHDENKLIYHTGAATRREVTRVVVAASSTPLFTHVSVLANLVSCCRPGRGAGANAAGPGHAGAAGRPVRRNQVGAMLH